MHDTALALFDHIYDAALQSERWQTFLGAYAQAIGGGATFLTLEHPKRFGVPEVISYGFGDGAVAAYFDYYVGVDPLQPRISAEPEGVFDFGEPYVPKSELHRSEIYHDWHRPNGLSGDSLGGIVHRRDAIPSVLGAYQERGRHNYSADDLALSRLLMPHLRRAMTIHHRLGDSARTTRQLLDAFDAFSFGVLILGRDGRLLAANRRARDLAAQRDGLLLGRGEVRCSRTDDTRALRGAIADALSTANGVGFGTGGAVSARRQALGPLQLLVTPLKTQHDETVDPPAAAVFIHEPQAHRRVPEERLQALFGLTPRQAAVAAELSEGKTLSETAAELGMSPNTVKVRLQEVFDKTQTHRQPELMHLLTRLALTLDG